MRRWCAWPVAVPLAVIGTLAGHAVGYRAAMPDAQERAGVLAASGHAYLEYAALAVALCGALAGLAFLATVLAAVRGRDTRGGGRQVALVAALAPVAFTLQELIERHAHDGQMHWGVLASLPFLLGLATQLPFALLAAAIAMALGVAAHKLAALVAARPPRARPLIISLTAWSNVEAPRLGILPRGYSGRGPPLPA